MLILFLVSNSITTQSLTTTLSRVLKKRQGEVRRQTEDVERRETAVGGNEELLEAKSEYRPICDTVASLRCG
jgi:hypothetical protein